MSKKNQLANSSGNVDSIFNSMSEGVYVIGNEGKCTFINKAALQMLGYNSAQCIGQNMHKLIHYKHFNGDDYDEHDCPIFKTRNHPSGCRIDNEVFWCANGQYIHVRYASSPIVVNEVIEGTVITFTDITEEITRKEEIGRIRANQAAIINASPDWIWSVDQNYNLITANNTFHESVHLITGKKISEGQSVFAGFTKEAIAYWEKYYKRALNGERFSVKEKLHDPLYNGKEHVFITFNPIYNTEGQQTGAACCVRNITDEILSSNALNETRAELQKVLDSSVDIICTVDENGRFMRVSEAARHILGYTPDELVGRKYTDFIYPDDIALSEATVKQIIRGVSVTNFHNRYIQRNGGLVPLVWSARWDMGDRCMYCVARDATERNKAQEQLQLSEQRFRNLVQYGSDLIAILDANGIYQYVSPTSLSILNIPAEELIGKNAFDFIHPDDVKGVLTAFQNLAFEKQLVIPEFRFKDRAGNWRWIETHICNMINDPAVGGIVANSRDITERKTAEDKLKHSEEKYKLLFKYGPLPKLIYDINTFQILDVNSIAVRHYGYSREEFLEMTIKELRPASEIATLLKGFKETLQTKTEIYHFGIHTHKKKDGSIIRVEVWGHRFDFEGQDCMMALINDVTERECILQQLQEKEEKLRTATEISSLGYWQLDLNSKELTWSDKVYQIWGIAPQAATVSFDFFMKTMPYRDRAPFLKEQAACMSGEQEMDFEHRVILPNGAIKWVHEKGKVVRWDNDIPVTFEGTVQDITSYKLLALSLEESNNRYTFVTRATSDAIWDWNIAYNTLYLGEGYKNIFGYELNELQVTVNYKWNLIHPEDRDRVLQSINTAIKQRTVNWQEEYRYKKANGQFAYVADRAFMINDHQGKPVRMVGAMQDISLRKAEEHRLKLLESVITYTNDLVLIAEIQQEAPDSPRVIYANNAFLTVTGYSASEIIGKDPVMLYGPKSDPAEQERLSAAMKKWESCDVTVINYKKNGEEFWNNFTVSPVADQNGIYTHWIAIGRDVTQRKTDELRKLLLGNISYIFNNSSMLPDSLQQVLQKLLTYGNLSMAEVWLVDADGERITLASKAFQTQELEVFYSQTKYITSFKRGEGLPGAVWLAEQNQFWTASQQEQFHRNEAALLAGLKNVYGIPLIHNQELIGVLILGLSVNDSTSNEFVALADNLSAHLSAEIKRKQLEIELSRVFSFSPDVICIMNMQGHFVKINPAACELLSYTEQELLQKSFTEFVHHDDRHTAQQHIEELHHQKTSAYFEVRHVTRTGKVKWLAWTKRSLPDEQMIFAVAKDITEKKHLEVLLSKATEMARIGSWEFNLLNSTSLWSPMMFTILEFDKQHIPTLDEALKLYKPGESVAMIQRAVNEAITQGKSWDIEVEIITARGRYIWVRVMGEPQYIDGQCTKLYGSFQDIDERKRAQIAINQVLTEKNSILESIGDGFFAVDNNWIVTYWNTQAERMLYGPKDNIIGKYLWDVFVDNVHSVSYNNYRHAMASRQVVRFEDWYEPLKKWYDISAYPSENGLSVYFKDITENKLSEIKLSELNENLLKKTRELEKSEKRYSNLFHSSPQPMWVYNLNTLQFLDVNEAAIKHYGYTRDEFLNQTLREIRPKEDRGVLDHLPNVPPNENYTSRGTYRHKKKNGELMQVEIYGNVITYKGQPAEIIFANDITERLHYINAMESQNRKLLEIAWIQSHILRAPVVKIIGLANLLNDYNHTEEEIKEMLKYILTSVTELDEAIKSINDTAEEIRIKNDKLLSGGFKYQR